MIYTLVLVAIVLSPCFLFLIQDVRCLRRNLWKLERAVMKLEQDRQSVERIFR